MKQSFNKKCKDYCRSKDTKEEIFIMTIGHDESLEDYEERFQLSCKRARITLDLELLKLVLVRGIKEDIMETLKMLSGGDIYQLCYDDIKTLLKNNYRVVREKNRDNQYFANSSSSTTSIKNEIGKMLEDIKSEMFPTFSLQMDTMKINRKEEELKRALIIFFPKCTRTNPRNECPLNVIEACSICEEKHSIEKCPYLP